MFTLLHLLLLLSNITTSENQSQSQAPLEVNLVPETKPETPVKVVPKKEPSIVSVVEKQPSTAPASSKTKNYTKVSPLDSSSNTHDSASSERCNPNYSGCLKADASDYDCEGGSGNGPYYTGMVNVIGTDVYGLDKNHDGVACE